MKNIQVSDEDYKVLMELSKELQLQDNNGQAFPYFWEPSSIKEEQGNEDDTPMVYNEGETYTLEECSIEYPDIYSNFLYKERHYDTDNIEYSDIDESDWKHYIERQFEFSVFYIKKERSTDHNPSLFQSDVKNFVENNSHHLGEKPATYSRSIWRMPKMISLVSAIYRLNKQPENEVNHEARR